MSRPRSSLALQLDGNEPAVFANLGDFKAAVMDAIAANDHALAYDLLANFEVSDYHVFLKHGRSFNPARLNAHKVLSRNHVTQITSSEER